MNNLTTDYDLAIQISENMIQKIVVAQHAMSILKHHYVGVNSQKEKRMEIQFGCPQVELINSRPNNKTIEALISLQSIYHSRDLYNINDIGESTVVDIVLRTTISLTTGNPGPLSHDSYIIFDIGNTSNSDLTIHHQIGQFREEVEEYFLDLIASNKRNKLQLPALGSGNMKTEYGGVKVASNGSKQYLIAGLNIGDFDKGNIAALLPTQLREEWQMIISSEFMLKEIKNGLKERIGDELPPPMGNTRLKISESRHCVLRIFGACIGRYTSNVFIETMDIILIQGHIFINGSIKVENSGIIPDINSSFRVRLSLAINNNQLQIRTDSIEADATGFFSDIANFFLGNDIEEQVVREIRRTIQGNIQNGQFSRIFTKDFVMRGASWRSNTNFDFDLLATSVDIQTDGIILIGQLAIMNPSSYEAKSEPRVLRPQRELTRRFFHGGLSWSPGDTLTKYHWEFGDGQQDIKEGNQAKFLTQHTYDTPGSYDACLTVINLNGKTAKSCVRIETAKLVIEPQRTFSYKN